MLCEPKAFWLTTGNNEIIGEIIAQADRDIYEKLTSLVSGQTIVSLYRHKRDLSSNQAESIGDLQFPPRRLGYLNAVKVDSSFGDDYMCELHCLIREISFVYRKEILQKLNNIIPPGHCNLSPGGDLLRGQQAYPEADPWPATPVR